LIKIIIPNSLFQSLYLEQARDRCPRGGWAVCGGWACSELALAGSSCLFDLHRDTGIY
jgi:hypothetical protein